MAKFLPSRASTAIVVIAALAACAGAAAIGAWWLGRPPEGGLNLLTASKFGDLVVFQVVDAKGLVLWRVEAESPHQVSRLHYGVLPEGFGQVVPASGQTPRAFQPGEELVTQALFVSDYFEHHGNALDGERFSGGTWESGPRNRAPFR